MAGYDDSIFGNLPPRRPVSRTPLPGRLPGSPYRPALPPDRSLAKTLMPVDPRAVVGGFYDQATEGAGNLTANVAGRVGLPDPDKLGRDVTAFMQSPVFGGGMSPLAGASTLAAAPLVARAARGAKTAEEAAPEARTAEEIATGTRAAQADAAAQAARAAQASPGQAALDRLTSGAAEEGPATKAAKGLPQVSWDAGQQRWLTDKGKPITSSPLDIPEGGPSYPNMFDPNDPALAQRPAGVEQFDLPRGAMTRGPAVSPRVADLIANPDVRNQVMDYVRQGQDIGDRWYNTTPILDSAVRALGPEAGQDAYQKYIGLVGATSPQQKVPSNFRTGSYYYWRDANGLPPMERGEEGIPPLYGHYVQKLHQQNVKAVLDSGDPLAAYDSAENPKPPSFNQGLLGNYSPVAVDMHAFKLPGMLSRDPRFLSTGGVQNMPGFNPREAVTSGLVSMDEAVKNPTWWEDAPNPKNEYPALEQYWKGIGADLNKDPAQAQAGGWIGGGGVTGLGSPPETAAQSFQNRIFNTAYRTGATPSEAENNFWRGVHPLLGVAGGGALAVPPMLQQYWNGQQPPGATGQGGAPAPPPFW